MSAEQNQQWWCPKCNRFVEPFCVTNDEHHDERAGGCGSPVMDRKPEPECCTCHAFKAAQENGTDNEGYSCLIKKSDVDGSYSMGSGLLSIEYCPWCGRKVAT